MRRVFPAALRPEGFRVARHPVVDLYDRRAQGAMPVEHWGDIVFAERRCEAVYRPLALMCADCRELLAQQSAGPVDRLDVYRALGQGEMRAGRSLETLLSAYRVGARVAWRRFAEANPPVAKRADRSAAWMRVCSPWLPLP